MDPKAANTYFQSRLASETDPSDVYTDIQKGETGFVVVDARTREAYMKGHVPGAVNLPYREITPASTASFAKDKLVVTYCDGVLCNASTKAAARLSALGFQVKEMLHGLAGWREEGYPVETGLVPLELEH
jgi:rhodanese-related sulfurtransferase